MLICQQLYGLRLHATSGCEFCELYVLLRTSLYKMSHKTQVTTVILLPHPSKMHIRYQLSSPCMLQRCQLATRARVSLSHTSLTRSLYLTLYL